MKWPTAYQPAGLRADLIAGLTAAAVVIPKAMAIAVIAGLSVEVGLYTALAAMLAYPLFGSSRCLSVSSTSAIGMLTATAVIAAAATRTGAPANAIAATLALQVGAVLVLARVLKLGFLANFISKPVLVGFSAGVGLAIIVGQTKALLDVPVHAHDTLGILLELPGLLTQTHGWTLLLGISGIAILAGMHHWLPRLPAPLVWVALAIAASALLGFEAHGVRLVGAVPAGLPALALPNLALAAQLWPAALGVALMSFTESVAAGRAFCARDDAPIDANRELLAVGAANLAAAVAGGMPAGGGTSQTAVADGAGARSQLAQWVAAAVVLLVLLLLSRVIGLLPQAALAALVVVVSAGMVKPAEFRAIARVKRAEWAWALVTLVGVVCIGTLEGIGLAVAVSVLTLIYQANHPPVYALAYDRQHEVFRRAGDHPGDELIDGLLMLRVEGWLTFANAANAQEKMQVLAAATTPAPRVIILECSAIPDIEYTALLMLVDGERRQRERGVSLWLAGLNPCVEQVIERSALGPILGPGRRYPNLRQALAAFEAQGRQA